MTYIAPEMNPNDMPDESVKPTPFQGLAVLTTSDQAAVEAPVWTSSTLSWHCSPAA